MLRYIKENPKNVVGLLFTVALFIFGEGILIWTIHEIGMFSSYIILPIVGTIFCLYLRKFYKDIIEKNNRIARFRNIIINLEIRAREKHTRLIENSKLLTIIISSLTSGVFVTTILICLFGYYRKKETSLIIVNNILFFIVWVTIYGGGLELINHYI